MLHILEILFQAGLIIMTYFLPVTNVRLSHTHSPSLNFLFKIYMFI